MGDKRTKACSPLCRLITKVGREKENLTLHPPEKLLTSPICKCDVNNFKVRKYASTNRLHFKPLLIEL